MENVKANRCDQNHFDFVVRIAEKKKKKHSRYNEENYFFYFNMMIIWGYLYFTYILYDAQREREFLNKTFTRLLLKPSMLYVII